MQSQWKLSRGLGIANLMVIHRLSDLLSAGDAGSRGQVPAEGLLADCSTRIIYRQEPDQLAAAASLLGLTGVETQAVANLIKGRASGRSPDTHSSSSTNSTPSNARCSTPTPAWPRTCPSSLRRRKPHDRSRTSGRGDEPAPGPGPPPHRQRCQTRRPHAL